MNISQNVYEAKKRFVENELAATLKYAYSFGAKIDSVTYRCNDRCDREEVIVKLKPYSEAEEGRTIVTDVTADSPSALLTDVVRVMNKHY